MIDKYGDKYLLIKFYDSDSLIREVKECDWSLVEDNIKFNIQTGFRGQIMKSIKS